MNGWENRLIFICIVVQYLSEYLNKGFHWELRGIRDTDNSEGSKQGKGRLMGLII